MPALCDATTRLDDRRRNRTCEPIIRHLCCVTGRATEMSDWEPDLYNRFRRYRAEPVAHILSRLQLGDDEKIIDLGGGTGRAQTSRFVRVAQPCRVSRRSRIHPDFLERRLSMDSRPSRAVRRMLR